MSNRENWSQSAAAGGAEQTDGQNSGPRVLMVLLVVLALIASILMLFLDSDLWLKIAVIAALWAAFLGIVLVSKYSSALRAEQKRVNTLERAHRAEMEREVAGYQQREAALKENYTRQLRNQRDEHLDQLRHELISLRAQLAEMSGEELDDEQTAVRARAERIIELDRGGAQPADRRYQTGTSGQAEWKQPQAGQKQPQPKQRAARSSQPGASARAASSAGSPTLGHHSEPSSDRRASAFSTGSFAAVKWTGDNTDETTQIPIVVDSNSSSSAQNTAQSGASGAQAAANRGSEAAEPKATGRGHHEQREAAQAEPQKRAAQSAPRTEPAFRAYEPSPAATEQASESAKKQAAPQAEKQREDAAPEKGGAHEYRAGRRRADENSEGLTVAELMKRFQQNDRK